LVTGVHVNGFDRCKQAYYIEVTLMIDLDYGIGILGVGKYIPSIEVTNAQVESETGISQQDILEKTGIQTRYIVRDDESVSSMSTLAAQGAIEKAGISPEEIGMIICSTFLGDYIYPATACKIQELLRAKNAGAFDILANCTGFQVGLTILSDRMYMDSSIEKGLLISSALQSRHVNRADSSAMYLGDGASATILGRVPKGHGVLANEIFTNGKVFESVRLRGGGVQHPLNSENINEGLQYCEINGMEVWKQVIQNQPKAIKKVLAKIDKTLEDVDFFIFHQANLRLIEYLMKKMRIPMEKTYTNVSKIGNTADASMGIALCEAVEKGRIKRGDLVLISGVGAGFTFGATALRWY
jgi:3-oxoacyl-[acyl-carrier-protein] synthase III